MTKHAETVHCAVALILVDVINHFEFPEGDRILRQALLMSPKLAKLKERTAQAGIPAIYVNDNFGQWRSDAATLIEYCTRPEAAGKVFVERLRPAQEDYFVLKPMHSAFFQTPLEVLLEYLGVTSLILCGVTTNSCIICTAHDAKMRKFRIIVPSDCSSARTAREHQDALRHLRATVGAEVMNSKALNLEEMVRNPAKKKP